MGKEICQAIYNNPRMQEIKQALQKNGFLTLEEKSEFINICDKIKYDIIYAKYGAEDCEGYKTFQRKPGKIGFRKKAWAAPKPRPAQQRGAYFIRQYSGPVRFLNNFEEEVLNTITND